jgi:hypothetical protein
MKDMEVTKATEREEHSKLMRKQTSEALDSRSKMVCAFILH